MGEAVRWGGGALSLNTSVHGGRVTSIIPLPSLAGSPIIRHRYVVTAAIACDGTSACIAATGLTPSRTLPGVSRPQRSVPAITVAVTR